MTTFERRHDTQAALAQSEARYRSLFENGYAPMLIIDSDDGRIHDANAAAEHFYGWSRAELCEMNVQDINLLSPQEVKQEMERTRASERNYSQFRHRLRDGSVRNVAVAVSAGATVHRPCRVFRTLSPRLLPQRRHLRQSREVAVGMQNYQIVVDRAGGNEAVHRRAHR
ncbi:MAG: PAS domain S-box protein [Spirochaetaceae bacterium]